MFNWLSKSRMTNPIGIDLSEQRLRAIQLHGEGETILAAAEWQLTSSDLSFAIPRTRTTAHRGLTTPTGSGIAEAKAYFGGGRGGTTATAQTNDETAQRGRESQTVVGTDKAVGTDTDYQSTSDATGIEATVDDAKLRDADMNNGLDLSIDLGSTENEQAEESRAADPFENREAVVGALGKLVADRRFRGRNVVLCLQGDDLFVQNARITKKPYESLDAMIYQEAEGRLPAPLDEMDLRFIEAGDVRQGNSIKSEVVLLASRKDRIAWLIDATEEAGLHPVAFDAEPTALLRAYSRLYRRDEDLEQSIMLVRIGYRKTIVVITGEENPLFVKHIDVGEIDFDMAVSDYLAIPLDEAVALRNCREDRRSNRRDPDVMRCLAEAVRPILDSFSHDLNMCVRYHSITFRRHPLTELILTGPGVDDSLVQWLSVHMNIPCNLGNPLRGLTGNRQTVEESHWDLAVGLALRGIGI